MHDSYKPEDIVSNLPHLCSLAVVPRQQLREEGELPQQEGCRFDSEVLCVSVRINDIMEHFNENGPLMSEDLQKIWTFLNVFMALLVWLPSSCQSVGVAVDWFVAFFFQQLCHFGRCTQASRKSCNTQEPERKQCKTTLKLERSVNFPGWDGKTSCFSS